MDNWSLMAVAVASLAVAFIGIGYVALRLADWQDTQEDYANDDTHHRRGRWEE